MDEDDINDLIQKCRKLKYKFCGVFDSLPTTFPKNSPKTVFSS